MDEVEASQQLTPIQEEAAFLKLLKENWTTNPKKLKKLAIRESAKQPAVIVEGIIASILRSPNPVGYVKECFRQAEVYPQIIAQFIADGYHGMMVVANVVHPVKLETRVNWLNVKDPWTEEQEIDIQHQVVDNWMAENGLNRYYGKIALFPVFGFSGYFRRIRRDRFNDGKAK